MNKKQFFDYMNQEMEGMTYDQKIKLLKKIETNYVPELIRKHQKKEGYWVPKEKENLYFYCKNCRKYTLKKYCKSDSEKKVDVETTYTDCGYGDDDMMGEVERLIIYTTCPHCGNKQQTHNIFLRVISEWNRREGRK